MTDADEYLEALEQALYRLKLEGWKRGEPEPVHPYRQLERRLRTADYGPPSLQAATLIEKEHADARATLEVLTGSRASSDYAIIPKTQLIEWEAYIVYEREAYVEALERGYPLPPGQVVIHSRIVDRKESE